MQGCHEGAAGRSECFPAAVGIAPRKLRLARVFDSALKGFLVTDKRGIITFISDQNARYFKVRPEEIIGRHVTSLSRETQMPLVLQTGQPQIGVLANIGGTNMIVNRIPIKNHKGEVVGAVGVLLFEMNEFWQVVETIKTRGKEKMETEKSLYGEIRGKIRSRDPLEHIVGESECLQRAKSLAFRFARTESNVLIQGESGTGKELFAHAIHSLSSRSRGPFIAVNCSTIPKELLESELFGYEGGSFTGALRKGKKGKFELAHKGTIFLDEIGDMPLEAQSKLLRVVEYKEVEKLGGEGSKRVDFRLIAATNKDLKTMVKKGVFREDLFYRLDVCHLEIPPLRQRKEDIPLLVDYYLNLFSHDMGTNRIKLDEKAMERLLQYHWPGNVRELVNVLERLIVSTDKTTIFTNDLSNIGFPVSKEARVFSSLKRTKGEEQQKINLPQHVEDVEREAIIKALRETKGNKRQTASILGISRSALYAKIKKYHLLENTYNAMTQDRV